MIRKIQILTLQFFFCIPFFTNAQTILYKRVNNKVTLTESGATFLAELPLRCIEMPFPYKTGYVLEDSTWLKMPKDFHPAFYGCFDWHSSVHGHWMLVKLLKMFPNLKQKERILEIFAKHFTPQVLQKELEILKTPLNKSFERTYGWAWILQLQNELLSWNNPDAKKWAAALQPMVDTIENYSILFFTKIVYPLRVGTHNNLAFGLSLMYDYAVAYNRTALKSGIEAIAKKFFLKDAACPISWEPNGSDFLSPCLEEANLMSKILPQAQFIPWVHKFLPQLFKPNFILEIAKVKDKTDGQLVHLDGLNFSRAWCLKSIATKTNNANLQSLSNLHLEHAMPTVASGDYMGEHWLASFAVYSLTR